MLGTQNLPLFVTSAVLLNLTPGQDTMCILGRGLAQGRRAGIVSALGICTGCIVHTFAAALGLSAVLAASANAFEAVKWAGAIYLVYLGIRMILSRQQLADQPAPASTYCLRIYQQAVLTNLLNPKVALFFLAFLPQFVDPMASHRFLTFLFLGGCFVCTGGCWCVVLGSASGSFRTVFGRHGTLAQYFQKLVGALFVLLGVRLAMVRRADR